MQEPESAKSVGLSMVSEEGGVGDAEERKRSCRPGQKERERVFLREGKGKSQRYPRGNPVLRFQVLTSKLQFVQALSFCVHDFSVSTQHPRYRLAHPGELFQSNEAIQAYSQEMLCKCNATLQAQTFFKNIYIFYKICIL